MNIMDIQQIVHFERAREFRRRVAHLCEGRQQLQPRGNTFPELRVVYVMTHVHVSGGAKVILQHANNLQNQGIDVTIVCHYPKPDWFPVNCRYVQVPFQTELYNMIPECDVIVATYWDHISACVESGIAPVVYFEQGDFHLFDDNVDDVILSIVQKMIDKPEFIMTVSKSAASKLKARFGRDSLIVPNALDRTVFYSRNFDMSNGSYVMIVGSDHHEFKAIPVVLEALAEVRERGYDLDLVWVSPQPPKNPVGRVFVQPQQQFLGDLYRGASLYVSGSRYESFSLPPLEAMACGCPVVSTANEGIQEYASDGYNCLLVGIDDIGALANSIINILTDDKLRNRLVMGGLDTAARFTWEIITSDLMQFYRRVAQYSPKPKYQQNDWDITVGELKFIDTQSEDAFLRFLQHTDKDLISLPVVYEIFEGHKLARWEQVAMRKVPNNTGEVKFFCPVSKSGVESPSVPYAEAYRCFVDREYNAALADFKRLFNESPSQDYKAVYARWIAICLLELDRDAEALKVLSQAYAVYPDNTDIAYLYALAIRLTGSNGRVSEIIERVKILGDCSRYPEFYFGVSSMAMRLA